MFIFRNNRNNPLKMKHSGWLSVILLIVLINLGQRVARLSKTCGKCEWNGKLTRFLDCVQTDKVDINMLCFSTSYGLENVTGLAFFSSIGKRNATSHFLSIGADPNIPGSFGRTALMYAAKRGAQGIVGDLLKKGAKINAQDKNGKTALMYAIGVFPRASKKWRAAFRNAPERDAKGAVGELLKKGANIEAQDKKGKTALMYAVQRRAQGIVGDLLKHGADVNAQDADGESAILYAFGKRFSDPKQTQAIFENLVVNGADVNTKTIGIGLF